MGLSQLLDEEPTVLKCTHYSVLLRHLLICISRPVATQRAMPLRMKYGNFTLPVASWPSCLPWPYQRSQWQHPIRNSQHGPSLRAHPTTCHVLDAVQLSCSGGRVCRASAGFSWPLSLADSVVSRAVTNGHQNLMVTGQLR